jgi:hypothetical protein
MKKTNCEWVLFACGVVGVWATFATMAIVRWSGL